jgi:hypothetical protein
MMEWFPPLPFETQAFIRSAYGVLMFLFFSIMLPYSRVYFTSQKYGGCVERMPWTDALLTPWGYSLLMFVWMGTSVLLILNIKTVAASLLNLALCYTFFIRMRWTSPLRGMGAPGYISYWIGAFIFLMEFAHYYGDPQGELRNLVVLMFRLDFAIMMLDSGINKIFHGYPVNQGMNFGMVNPAWGYWPHFFRRFPANSIIFHFFNHSAYFFQILGAVLLLFPPTYWLGAFIIFASFLLVLFIIRLGVLCPQLMLIAFIYTRYNGIVDQFLQNFSSLLTLPPTGTLYIPWLSGVVKALVLAYIILLPLAKIGMYLNFYFKKTLPPAIQKALEIYTNAVGIILWRVFTIELIDYYLLAYFQDPATGKRIPITRLGRWKWNQSNRFLWVGESIMSVIVFNTERYFLQPELFHKRILQYAGTFGCPAGQEIIFEWIVINIENNRYVDRLGKEYRVNLSSGTIQERILDSAALAEQKKRNIAMHASARPGSYAPAPVK